MHRIRQYLTYANVLSTLSLFLVLGGGTALAAYVVSSNSQIGPNTVSGHKPPSGQHANIIAGSINATDLANQAVTAAKIGAPEAWHQVAAGSISTDCSNSSLVATFCTNLNDLGNSISWQNFGGGNATAAFYKDQLGIIHLKGLVVPPDRYRTFDAPDRRPIFRLPTGYRPQSTRVFPSVGRNHYGQEVAQARVDVQSDGLVMFESDCEATPSDCSADLGYLTLDGITFRPTG
jgi:hypothetical protein